MEAATQQAPLVQVSGLKVQLGNPPVQAVRGIDFQIQPGEFVGLAGESGSGKSITAMALTRLVPKSAHPVYGGSVNMEDSEDNLLQYSERRLRSIRGNRIGYIFQEPSTSFNPLFTIESHLHEAHQVTSGQKKRDHAAISQALEEVGIPADSQHLKAWPGSFSGGMLQRTAIACALLAKPDLLIADEPTTALDTTTQKRIMDLLARLNKDHGMAVLFISHDLGLLKDCSTRLMVMRQGEIVETGETRRLIDNPQHEYTRHLLETAPKLRLSED